MATRTQLIRDAESRGLKGPVKTAWVRAQLANEKLTSAREIERQKKQLAAEKARIKREETAARKAKQGTRSKKGASRR